MRPIVASARGTSQRIGHQKSRPTAIRTACSIPSRTVLRSAASYTAPRWMTYQATSHTGSVIAGRVIVSIAEPPRAARAARIAGVSPISRSGGAQSLIITFCSRWNRTRYSTAIVPSGEFSAPTTRTTPAPKHTARHHGPGIRRQART